MTSLKHIPDKASSKLFSTLKKLKKRLPDPGFFILLAVIMALSAIAASDFSGQSKIILAGEIAPADIAADRSFLQEDREATRQKLDRVRQMQPLVCDLVQEPADNLRSYLQGIFIALNRSETPEEKEEAKKIFWLDYNVDISIEALELLADVRTQEMIAAKLLPFLQQQLASGIIMEMRVTLPYKGGVIIRNLASGEEILHPEVDSIPDIRSIETLLSQKLKDFPWTSQKKKTVTSLLTSLVQPTLIPNYQATTERMALVERAVEPVTYRVERGEVIVRLGEKVTREQQIKLQYLQNKRAERFNLPLFFGATVIGALLSVGLLFSPAGRPSKTIQRRDYIFIASLLFIFSLLARGLFTLGMQLSINSPTFSPETMAYAIPVAGAAAISSLIFATRRYVAVGLLMAFFCSIMCNGDVALFLFYFMSTMWSTWCVTQTQSRQDIVWAIIPLTLGLFAMWLGSTLIQGGPPSRFILEGTAVLAASSMSLILTFALAPVIEMVFGYTTRFKLMELLNLEQPILRDLMLNAPGTYHHSLIVSNMVEAGAEVVGAHGLLCKVAALYHDIGKLSKAGYFIENQFTAENPHDQLTPSMSALILTSHVKQGAELAEKHRLGKEVIDVIRQHHGNSVIRYFFQKAQQAQDGPAPKVEDFSYPGPKPQSKEAALVLLADVIEASSRTLHSPSPTKLKLHIDSIIKGIYSSGQLDESELTFRDLDKLSESYHRVLRGIFHHRIAYPDQPTKASPQAPAPLERDSQAVADSDLTV